MHHSQAVGIEVCLHVVHYQTTLTLTNELWGGEEGEREGGRREGEREKGEVERQYYVTWRFNEVFYIGVCFLPFCDILIIRSSTLFLMMDEVMTLILYVRSKRLMM